MEGTSETPHYQIRGRAKTAQTHRERSGWLCSEGSEGSGLQDSVKVPFPVLSQSPLGSEKGASALGSIIGYLSSNPGSASGIRRS